MCLSLPQEVLKIERQCQDIHDKDQLTVHQLTKLLGVLVSTIQAILQAQMNF